MHYPPHLNLQPSKPKNATFKSSHHRKLVGMTVDSAPTMRINTQGFGRVATAERFPSDFPEINFQ